MKSTLLLTALLFSAAAYVQDANGNTTETKNDEIVIADTDTTTGNDDHDDNVNVPDNGGALLWLVPVGILLLGRKRLSACCGPTD
jgi:hypothetical protein